MSGFKNCWDGHFSDATVVPALVSLLVLPEFVGFSVYAALFGSYLETKV